jgi:hypothetical protein
LSTPDHHPWRVDQHFDGCPGLAWCEEYLDHYDLSKLSRLTVRDGSGRERAPAGVWGTCYYPTQKIPSYRITCSIKGPFPATTHTRKSPLYPGEDGTYPPIPYGLVRGQEFVSTRNGTTRRWIRLYGQTRLETLDEAIVWIVAHEAFHFLRKTRQVPGRNMEIDADTFSDEALEHFREDWSPRQYAMLQEQRMEKVETTVGKATTGKRNQ